LLVSSAAGCDAPEATTDLRPEGDPEVLAVLVMNDPDSFFVETATFCAPDDPKRPGLVGTPCPTCPFAVQICDDDLSVPAEPVSDATTGGAVPTAWYVRVMFDELLDPDVEELIDILDPVTMLPTGQFTGTLLNTQPVVLTCNGVTIPYDGYYSPSGNRVTWPLGPSLVIQPLELRDIATSADCSIQIRDNFTDKQGFVVPEDQRGTAGEYAFQVSALAFAGTSPRPGGKICSVTTTQSCDTSADCEDGESCVIDPEDQELIAPEAPMIVSFNAFIDAATLDAGEVTIREVPVDAMGIPDCEAAGTAITAQIDEDLLDELSLNISDSTAPNTCADAMGNTVQCAWKPNSAYVVTFNAANEVADLAGGTGTLPEAEDFTLCFTTDAIAP
jgi:hypothetical protein